MFKLISSFFSKFNEKKNIILKLISACIPKLIEKKNNVSRLMFSYLHILHEKQIPVLKEFFKKTKNFFFQIILIYFANFNKKQILILVGFLFIVFLLIIFAIKKPSESEIKNEHQSLFLEDETKSSSVDEKEKDIDLSENKPKSAFPKKLSDNVKKTQPSKKQKLEKKQIKKAELTEKKKTFKTLSAKFTINNLHNGLGNISKSPNDFDQIFTLVKENYDSEKMLEKIIGSTWRKLKKNKRNEIKKVFEEYIAKNYVKRFRKIENPIFEYKETKQIENNISMVATNLFINDEKVSMNYLLEKNDYKWRIFDVLLAGSISEVATKRSEFRGFIKNEDIDPLIEALKKKNNQLIN